MTIQPKKTLKESLAGWTDFDVAAHALGVLLGLFPLDSKMSDFKGTFWSDNDIGNALHEALSDLAEGGILEENYENGMYRWKSS